MLPERPFRTPDARRLGLRPWAGAAFVLCLASCAFEGPGQEWWRPSKGTSRDAGAVAAAIEGMYQAFQQRNLGGVGKYMTPDSTCYDASTSQLLVGRQAVLDHFGAILARHKEGEKWESSMEDLEVLVSGDLAVATYRIRTGAEGAHALAAVTHAFRRTSEGWKAVHLHRSWNVPK